MSAEPVHDRFGNGHRWVTHDTFSLTSRQAGDIERGLDPGLPLAARMSREVLCFDCGAPYAEGRFTDCAAALVK